MQSISESFIPLPVYITRLEMNTSIQILSFLAKKFNDNVTIFCCNSPEKKTSKLEKGYNFFFSIDLSRNNVAGFIVLSSKMQIHVQKPRGGKK